MAISCVPNLKFLSCSSPPLNFRRTSFHSPSHPLQEVSFTKPNPNHQKTLLCNTNTLAYPTKSIASVDVEAYDPCSWDYDLLETLPTRAEKVLSHKERVDELVKQVKLGLVEDMDILLRLEMIDDIGRFGLGYHFENEIRSSLDTIASCVDDGLEGLHGRALKFRVLRQYGYEVSQDVFDKFKDTDGSFNSSLCNDTKGILSLYEASFLGKIGEETLDDARTFTIFHLNKIQNDENIIFNGDKISNREITHALKLPRHWRTTRAEARWYIDSCGEEQVQSAKFQSLLELAKLDFNCVQTLHQKELAQLIRWWKDLGLKVRVQFARDRLVESYLWGLGTTPDPEFSNSRVAIAKALALITVVDDVYDVYGSMEELKIFTNAIQRWDVSASDQLPSNIRLCFMAVFNTVNEMAYQITKEYGFDSLPYLKKSWTSLCNAYMKEAEIAQSGRSQGLEEYLENGWISISAVVMLTMAFFWTKESFVFTKESSDYIVNLDITKWSCMIARLTNDLGTSKAEVARGDILKAVECYQQEMGVSREVAREYISTKIGEMWTMVNKHWLEDLDLPKPFVMLVMNLARAAQYLYENGDGFGAPRKEEKDSVMSLFLEPISI